MTVGGAFPTFELEIPPPKVERAARQPVLPSLLHEFTYCRTSISLEEPSQFGQIAILQRSLHYYQRIALDIQFSQTEFLKMRGKRLRDRGSALRSFSIH